MQIMLNNNPPSNTTNKIDNFQILFHTMSYEKGLCNYFVHLSVQAEHSYTSPLNGNSLI